MSAVSPGWLQTSLGGTDHADAHLTASQGARATVDIIMSSEAGKDNGACRDIYIEGSDLYTGKIHLGDKSPDLQLGEKRLYYNSILTSTLSI